MIIEKINIGNPIGNLYRKNHVLVLVCTQDGGYILGSKVNFYPSEITRMIGGGINANEEPRVAAKRELDEELGINVALSRLKDCVVIKTIADTTEGEMTMTTYVFTLKITQDEELNITPSDDISGVTRYTTDEYQKLVENMANLEGTYVGVTTAGKEFTFDWSDWGKIYAPIHRAALDVILLT